MNALNYNHLLPLLPLDLSLLAPTAGQEGTLALLQAQSDWNARVGIIPPPENIVIEIDRPDQP